MSTNLELNDEEKKWLEIKKLKFLNLIEKNDSGQQNFRCPASIKNEAISSIAFTYISDEYGCKVDNEMGLNLIFFYENIDKKTFDKHKNN
ncbi:uncharacterized protein OCT59_013711 [Rhizophagus irregularis]|uniref:uncharacterized protein n=1 Tax=Rhizophagus irregularis TaxID=588596 RepID=UPI001C1A5062|nr:hypothetical protein OCT59_013711 [Rhizophagus irregularis]CAB4480015.1 unnamed protein product [Rhizophagus irregularis]CAB5190204.1 unnamed protein product [Rhizophagus irregularis]